MPEKQITHRIPISRSGACEGGPQPDSPQSRGSKYSAYISVAFLSCLTIRCRKNKSTIIIFARGGLKSTIAAHIPENRAVPWSPSN